MAGGPRVAVVLAAGLGERLGGRKPLRRLMGRPLVSYPVSVLHLLGVSEFVVVTRAEAASEIVGVVESVAGRGSARLVLNREPWRENGFSLVLGVEELQGEAAMVTMSDHVYSPLVAARVASAPRGGYVVGCDREPGWVDVTEATRVLADGGGRVERIGKGLEPWSCVDNGVHRVEPGPWLLEAAQLASGLGGGVLPLNSLLSTAAARGAHVHAVDCTALPWLEVDTPEDLENAEKGRGREVVLHVLAWLRS